MWCTWASKKLMGEVLKWTENCLGERKQRKRLTQIFPGDLNVMFSSLPIIKPHSSHSREKDAEAAI